MTNYQVLMLSSSRSGNGAYLATSKAKIYSHINNAEAVFIPYAGVTVDYDAYTNMVATALPQLSISGIHTYSDPVEAVNQATAILVGGGNTFQLLSMLYANALIAPIQAKVQAGTPYVGWSAGSNICGATIKTTNDMPIAQPHSFNALEFLPFQLNPHYSDYHPPGFHGETRDQRLSEFTTLHPNTPVVALPEGTALLRSGMNLQYQGEEHGYVFVGNEKRAIEPGVNLEYLLA